VRYFLNDLTFYLTEDCNLRCLYCFQKRRARRLDISSIRKALEFFQEGLQKESFISFYGGEPLLEFDSIRQTVSFIENHKTLSAKKLRYSISINGTLLTEEILRFLNAHKFKVNLSHDGTAQGITRPSSLNPLVLENMERLNRLPDIEFETNSVFVPATVGEIFRSARFLLEKGIRNCRLTYSLNAAWDSVSLDRMREEVQELREYLLSHYRQHRAIPVQNFQSPPSRGLFRCAAGHDRFALAADDTLWGCRFFVDYFIENKDHPEGRKFCFGDIHEFVLNHHNIYPMVSQNYRVLRQDKLSSERMACLRCARLLFCSACPATAAYSTGVIGKIPAWMCEMKEIWLRENEIFWEEAGKS
jgi:uncharacterized protein